MYGASTRNTQQLRQTIVSIRSELDDPDEEGTDYADVRQRLSWMLTALRHQRARESDLLYEAYYDAFHAELGLDDDHGQSLAQQPGRRPRGTRSPQSLTKHPPAQADGESPPFGAHPIDATTVAVSGEIDVYTAPDLTALLADPIVERVIMTDVSFIDAAGLEILLEAHRPGHKG